MKDFKKDSNPVLARFGRDRRERTSSDEQRPHTDRRERRQDDAERTDHRSDGRPAHKSYNPNFTGENRPAFGRDDRERRPYGERREGEHKPYGEHKSYGERRDGEHRSYGERREGERREGEHKPYGERKSFGDKKQFGDRKPFGDRERKPYGERDRKPYGERREGEHKPYGEHKSYGERRDGEYKPYGERKFGDRKSFEERGERKSYGERREEEHKSYGNQRKPYGDRDRKPYGDRDRKPFGERRDHDRKPYGERRSYERRDDEHIDRRPPRETGNYPKYAAPKQEGAIRLNRFIAQSGICSRREADDYITAGVVTVNGQVVTELGTKVMPTDEVKFNDERLSGEKKVYLVLNKPKGYVTTLEDPHAHEGKTVMDLVKDACTERIYPVGRLDKNSLGLLLFTNDGDMTRKLTHPSYLKKKVYQVSIDKPMTKADLEQLVAGIVLEDGEIHADEAAYVKENRQEIGLEIHSGRNRIVRRMFEYLGYVVTKLDRVYYAGLTKKNLKRGAWRFLTREEVERLQSGQYE